MFPFYMVVTGAGKGVKRRYFSSKKAALNAAKGLAMSERRRQFVLQAAASIDLSKAVHIEEVRP